MRGQRHAIDLIEEQRAAARVLEFSGPRLDGTGEGAGLVSEKFAFDHSVGDRSTVDRNVITFVPPPEIVQTTRDQVLARAGLAEQDHAHVGTGEFGRR